MTTKARDSDHDHSQHAQSGSGASTHDEHGLGFWLGVAVGGAILGFGVRGALHDFKDIDTRFVYFRYLVASDLYHDLLIAPVAFAVSWLASRTAPRWLRPPLTFGGFASAITITLAWYPLHGTGRHKQNPSIQPLNYATAVATVLVVVWGIAAIWAALALRRHTQPTREPSTPPTSATPT